MTVRSGYRTKRTYNLSDRAIQRVRDLARNNALPQTQDAVVEIAIDRLYESVRYADESAQWEAARSDPEFKREMASIAKAYRDEDDWPI